MKIISVIMPVFNGAKYLDEAIKSILDQTREHFEFLIFDDGSTDNTREMLYNYSNMSTRHDPRIRIGWSNENIGVTAALNRCLGQCKGEYIARMDADDVSNPDRLMKQVEFLFNHPEIAAVGARMIVCNEELNPITTWCHLTEHEDIEKALLNIENADEFVIGHNVVMYRRSALNVINNYDEGYKYAQDVDLYLRLIDAGYKLANLPDLLIKYRIHKESVCNKNFDVMFRDAQTAINESRIRRGLPALPYSKSERKNYL